MLVDLGQARRRRRKQGRGITGKSRASVRLLGADERELLHPYSYLLFLGADERGDMIPTKALRERYSQPRVDVYPPSPSERRRRVGEREREKSFSLESCNKKKKKRILFVANRSVISLSLSLLFSLRLCMRRR